MNNPGRKNDSGKPRMELIEPLFLSGLASVLTFGATKYSPNNWRNGLTYTRVIGAMMRHTNALAGGEDRDPETGLLHAYHIACCAMFISWYQETRKVALDDRIVSDTSTTNEVSPIKGMALTENESITQNERTNDRTNDDDKSTSNACRRLAENGYIDQ